MRLDRPGVPIRLDRVSGQAMTEHDFEEMLANAERSLHDAKYIGLILFVLGVLLGWTLSR